MIINEIILGDVREIAKILPSCSVNCIVTSPPYWGLRSYLDNDDPDKGLEIGHEETPDEYVTGMDGIFRELKRVLRDDGVMFLNLGDTYGGGNYRGNSELSEKQKSNRGAQGMKVGATPKVDGLPSKNLVGIPWRVALALQADGWILRSDIIWSKPNPLPESVTDRPTKSHEYIFLLAKSEKYYYDIDAIREPYAEASLPRAKRGVGENNKWQLGAPGSTAHTISQPRENIRKLENSGYSFGGDGHSGYYSPSGRLLINPLGRNRRTVWSIPTKSYRGAHFATFPPELIRPCILAGCPEGGVVLDPFMGSGTTAQVCIETKRNWLGIELNSKYIDLAKKRIKETQVPLIPLV